MIEIPVHLTGTAYVRCSKHPEKELSLEVESGNSQEGFGFYFRPCPACIEEAEKQKKGEA